MKLFSVPVTYSVRFYQQAVICRLCSSSETKEGLVILQIVNILLCSFYRKRWSDIRKEQKSHYPDGWKPKKKLTRYQMDYLRTLKQNYPEGWSVSKLASQFGISSSAVVRILKSKWEPSPEVQEKQDSRALELREQRRQEATGRPVKELAQNKREEADAELVLE